MFTRSSGQTTESRFIRHFAFILLAGLFVIGTGTPSLAGYPPAETHPLFDGDAVHEIHLTFSQSNWWTLLENNFEGLEDPLYLEADFDWDGLHLDDIGVRFKGSSSYNSNPTDKKSFKLDIDEFVADQTIYGLDKLNLNCNWLDPSGVREKCMYELCYAAGLPTERTNYAALYINGDYFGLYTIVEQFDGEFIDSRFGSDQEDGNLWKGDDYGTLEYLGTNQESYYGDYELKTNETTNDWSALIELTDGLNNTALVDLPGVMHELIDVNSALALIAVDNLCVNLDTYIGRCANYYMYHRDLDSRFVFANWDLNESFGVFNQYGMSTTQMKQLSPYWTNPQGGEDRPLAERLWQVDAYDDIYIGHLQKLMATAADPDTLIDRMEALRTLIQPYVYAEVAPRRIFTSTQFNLAMSTDQNYGSGGPGGRPIPGLDGFIRDRHTWLSNEIGTWAPLEGLVINELMASNSSTLADEHGDFDDWIEIYNGGTETITLTGMSLTDDLSVPDAYVFPSTFPATTIAPGEYMIIWADEEPEEGDYHANFKLKSEGEPVYLLDGGVIVDDTTWQPLGPDVPWGRWPNGTGNFQVLGTATPGAENDNSTTPEEIVLFVNEFMADNTSYIEDPDEPGTFPDWVEIYNPGPADVEMEGLYLTDDLTQTTQWAFPELALGAGEFVVVWCDDDEGDGPLHTNFKLGASGEDIAIYGRVDAGNELIDSYTFGQQLEDQSEGRETDGAATWVFFADPTPGTSNGTVSSDTVDAQLACTPSSGTVPFSTQMSINLTNLYTGQTRRLAGRMDVTIAGGTSYPNWRAGFTNVAAGDSYVSAWMQNIPALGTLVGDNVFSLLVEDVTPSPYNQPPYPMSGDTATDTCVVTGIAP